MQAFKSILWAFVIGGCIAVIAQLLFIFYGNIIPDLTGPLALVTMGFLGSLFVAWGPYGKLEKLGLMGTTAPFSGLGAVIVNMYTGVKLSGGSTGQAVGKALIAFLQVVGIGSVGAAIIGVIAYFVV